MESDARLIVEQQREVSDKPYSINARLKLASAYKDSDYHDLAAAEAYIALLLIDEVNGASGEFEDEAIAAALQDFGRNQSGEHGEKRSEEEVVQHVDQWVRGLV
jgi:hypothetical protein